MPWVFWIRIHLAVKDNVDFRQTLAQVKLLLLDVDALDQLVLDFPLVNTVGRVWQLQLVVDQPDQSLVCLFEL